MAYRSSSSLFLSDDRFYEKVGLWSGLMILANLVAIMLNEHGYPADTPCTVGAEPAELGGFHLVVLW